MFLEKSDQKTLDHLLKKWWIGVYGSDPKNLQISIKTFEPIFLSDLFRAKGILEKAIEIGKNRA